MILAGVAVFASVAAYAADAASAADEPIVISTSYNNLLSNPEQTGMLDQIIMEAFARINVPVTIAYTDTETSLIDVNAGLLDGEINRIAGIEQTYPNLVRVPEPNMIMRFVAFAGRDHAISGWDSLRNREIGLVAGWKILEENTEGFPYVTRVPTEIELFRMLALDRIDVALYSQLTGYAVLNDLGYEGIRHLEPALAEREMFLYLHARHADLAPLIADALRAMKRDGTYAAIVERCLSTHMIPSPHAPASTTP